MITNEYSKKYYEENKNKDFFKKKNRQNAKEWYQKNKERKKEYQKKYHEKHKKNIEYTKNKNKNTKIHYYKNKLKELLGADIILV